MLDFFRVHYNLRDNIGGVGMSELIFETLSKQNAQDRTNFARERCFSEHDVISEFIQRSLFERKAQERGAVQDSVVLA